MNANESFTESIQTQKLEKLYGDTRHWKSVLRFMQDEITFIEGLLNSYAFQPHTPNLFERLQEYLMQLKKTKSRKKALFHKTLWHEKNLSGMLECKDESCDFSFYQKHNVLKAEIVGCVEDFHELKAEVFNYAGGMLKKRKPKKN